MQAGPKQDHAVAGLYRTTAAAAGPVAPSVCETHFSHSTVCVRIMENFEVSNTTRRYTKFRSESEGGLEGENVISPLAS